MREIKYRGWIDTEERHGGQEMGEVCKINEITHEIGLYNHGDFSMGDVVLMQYTGLKDTKGVEIYEGDIVRAMVHDFIAEIRFYQSSFCLWYDSTDKSFVHKDIIDEFFGGRVDRNLTVIGNIYENKELLQ